MNALHYGITLYREVTAFPHEHFGIILTHDNILAHPIHIRLVPGGQSVDSYKVGLKLAIRVGEDSLQPGNELCGAAFVWTQEKPLLVIVIGVNVVPDNRGSS